MQNITKASTESESSNCLVILPYIKGTTEQLKRVLCKHKFKVAMKPIFTLRSQLMRPSAPRCAWGVETKWCCLQYSMRRLRYWIYWWNGTSFWDTARWKRASGSIEKRVGNSALAKHVHDEDHSVPWKKSRTLCKENRWAQRKWKEACFIEQAKNGIANRDNGMTLPGSIQTNC